MTYDRLLELLHKLTVEEKCHMLSGKDAWRTYDVPRLGIPSVKVSDGPNGARGDTFFGGTEAVCFPNATCLAATWDTKLLYEVGVELGKDTKTKNASVLLAPTINCHRSPLGGRHFESYSEDPVLSGKIAAAYINGLQSQGVGATIKHFAANETEWERRRINVNVSEKALREIYHLPFQIAIREARPWCVMTSYSKVNGTYASENHAIFEVLKEWGFDGLVMSDWYGTYSTGPSVNGGLDLEMPGPAFFRGPALVKAVQAGQVSETTVDIRVMKVLRLIEKSGKFDHPDETPEYSTPDPPKVLLRKAASDGMVLLKNEGGILPLEKSVRVALIGAAAKDPVINGGGSASLNAQYKSSALETFTEYFDHCQYSYGIPTFRRLPELPLQQTRTKAGKHGVDLEYINGKNAAGTPVFSTTSQSFSQMLMDSKIKGLEPEFTLRMTTTFTPETSGIHTLSIITSGDSNVVINGKSVFSYVADNQRSHSDLLFDSPAFEQRFPFPMESGVEYAITLTGFSNNLPDPNEHFPLQFFRIGYYPEYDFSKSISTAVETAESADVAVVFAGTNEEWETEGWDRPDMDVPFRQNELILAVAKVKPTIVILQSGAPVDVSPWIESVAGLVQAWFPGQECGNAILDIVNGTTTPSGKLPFTWPKKLADNPTVGNFPVTKDLEVNYKEGVFVGYRHYEKNGIETQFPFGFGLSYTTFELSKVTMDCPGSFPTVTVEVENTGGIAGSEVVQLYVGQDSFDGPVKELKAFKKVGLAPGGKETVEMALDKYAFSHWDETADQWRVVSGGYKISVGFSAEDVKAMQTFVLKEDFSWRGLYTDKHIHS